MSMLLGLVLFSFLSSNRSYGGAPGSGKSTLMLQDLIEAVLAGVSHILLIDPKGSLARAFGLWLYCLGIPFTYDRARDEGKVLGYKLIEKKPSRVAQDLMEKALVEFFLAERGFSMKSGEHPLLRQGIWFAVRLVLHQRKPVPFWKIQYALRLFHPEQERLLAGCTDPELIWVFGQLKRLTKYEQEKQLLPAQRVFDSVFGNPVLRDRCDGTFEL